MSEMAGELFVARDTPEAPKQSLFKSLLAGVPRSVDREELCKHYFLLLLLLLLLLPSILIGV